MIRVAIADDHPEMRTALRLLLRFSDTLELVSLLRDGQEAVDFVKHFQPDVLVMDIMMPGLDGFAAAKPFNALSLRTRILLISGRRGSYIVEQARQAGAHGFLPKDNLGTSLAPAVEALYRGEEFFVK